MQLTSEARDTIRERQEADLRALVERMARHDEAAAGEFYDRTNRLIYSLTLRMLGQPEDAEEATLDAYTKAWKIAATYDGARGSVTAWLVIIARSIAIDRIRARRSQPKPVATPDFAEQPSADADPEETASTQQERLRVRKALESLPPEQRRALELAYFSGLSHTELAEALGAPLGTVKTRVRLGMKRLRELLEDLS